MGLVKKILRKVKSILKRILRPFISSSGKFSLQERVNVSIVKNSEYFDPTFYLAKNGDVARTGIDPAVHYSLFGWKEHRDPSETFSNDLYLKLNQNKIQNVNPIVHYETKGKNDSDIIGPGHRRFSGFKYASEIVQEFFRDIPKYDTLPVSRDERRFNICFNGFDKSCFFGGKATALILAIQYATKYNYDLRIISQNPDPNILGEFIRLFDLETPKKVEYFASDFGTLLEVSDKDDFICTMWENAAAVLENPIISGNVYYIMQEVETLFYDHGDKHLKCYQTLTNPRLIPIVNSQLLHDYLIQNGYNNVIEKGIYFEPVFSPKLLKPSEDSFKEKSKYKLLFYGRPSHQRNVFYFGVECLNEAFIKGILNPEEWEVYLAGDLSVPQFGFDVDVKIKKLGIMSWLEYCNFVSTIDLCYSMIYTPHPSYPPLDTNTAGAVSVTNRCCNKTDLSKYSENIVIADLNKESMLEAFEKAVELVKDPIKRKENYEKSHTAGFWTDAFAPVLEHMHKFVEDDK